VRSAKLGTVSFPDSQSAKDLCAAKRYGVVLTLPEVQDTDL